MKLWEVVWLDKDGDPIFDKPYELARDDHMSALRTVVGRFRQSAHLIPAETYGVLVREKLTDDE